MQTLIVVSIFLSISFSFSAQVVPFPKVPEGLVIGDPTSSKIHLEAHYDLLCPDCRDSYFALSKVIKELDLLNKNFSMTIHFFPWPFHTYSFLATVVAKYLQTTKSSADVVEFMELIFNNQGIYYAENITISDVKNMLSVYVDDANSAFNSTYNTMARVSFKIGTQRGVVATPTYFVNDVKLDDSKTYEYKDWLNFAYQYVLGWNPEGGFLG